MITDKLREIRKLKKITRVELSKSTGISCSLLSLIESGKSNPSINTLDKIATSLGVTISIVI